MQVTNSGNISKWGDRYYVKYKTEHSYNNNQVSIEIVGFEVRDGYVGAKSYDDKVVAEYKTKEEAEAMCKLLNY